MPPINNRPISDITFLDSLTGFAVTPYTANDTAYILKTTNGGDNWNIIFRGPTNTIGGFNRVQFLNLNTGYVCGNFLRKTINGGTNWFPVNTSGIFPMNMHVLNEDTIWLVDSDGLVGGVFLTPNGGVNWFQQAAFNPNPSRIYMFDRNIGFVSASTGQILRMTTDGGSNWTTFSTAGAFTDMFFADSLTGWKSGVPGGPGQFRKTTDGGYNWFDQTMPSGGNIVAPLIERFDNISRDTIWGVGAMILTGSGIRGMVNRTINGGTNWLFQVPDTNININQYNYIDFYNKLNGWAYPTISRGIHTTTGGDPIWYTGILQTTSEVPKSFILKQNYPNPFNPRTVIPYSLKSPAYVRLIAYDITGREVQRMVNQKQDAGEYEVDFMGKFSATGVYFYRMTVDDKIIDTKKMILIK